MLSPFASASIGRTEAYWLARGVAGGVGNDKRAG